MNALLALKKCFTLQYWMLIAAIVLLVFLWFVVFAWPDFALAGVG